MLDIGVSIIDVTRSESDSIRHDPKINRSDMDLFFYLNRVESGSGQPDPVRLIIFFEVILY
jgi:hypothetical protein